MNIRQLEYFIVLAQERSINKAAKILFMSQQCLSKSLNSMEVELGGKLFYRSHNGITCTPLGERFLEFASNTVKEYKNLRCETEESKEKKELSGTLHLGVTAVIADDIMPEILSEYCNAHKGVNISITETTNYDVIKLIKNKKIDMGILVFYVDSNGKKAPVLPNGYQHGFLCKCSTIIWAGKKMFQPQKKYLQLEELQEYPVAIYKNTDMKFFGEVVFRNMKIKTPDIPLANNMKMITKMVENNKALCIDMQMGDNKTLYQNHFENLQVNRFDIKSNTGYTLYLCYILKENTVLSDDLIEYMRDYFS